MALTKGKHVIAEFDGVRCTVVETGATEERVIFLKDLLEFNKFVVKTNPEKKAKEDAPQTFSIGVTDIIFNPVYAVYDCSLKDKDGRFVSPAHWNQVLDKSYPFYWKTRRKKIKE